MSWTISISVILPNNEFVQYYLDALIMDNYLKKNYDINE